MPELTYHEQAKQNAVIKLRELQKDLPAFLRDYFRGIEYKNAPRTLIAYAIDLKTFFEFIHDNNSFCREKDIHDFPVDILTRIQAVDIEEFLDSVEYLFEQAMIFTDKINDTSIKNTISNRPTVGRYKPSHAKRISCIIPSRNIFKRYPC